jgi:hypothetical protein
VIESNKFIVPKCGQFIGKYYESRGLFHFSISDFYNKSVNNICDSINEINAKTIVQLKFNPEFIHCQRF